MVATWLIHSTGLKLAPAFYLVACAAIGAIALLAMRDWSRAPLR
jgi:hypothetical protein